MSTLDVSGDPQVFHLFDLVTALSTMIDLLNPKIVRHQRETAYIAIRVAEEVGYSPALILQVQMAAMVHDLGMIVSASPLHDKDGWHIETTLHPEIGYEMLKYFPYESSFRQFVRYHHVDWDSGRARFLGNGELIPEASFLLGLADKVSVMLRHDEMPITQKDSILEAVKAISGTKVVPEHVEAFLNVAKKESFWFDLGSSSLDKTLEIDSALSRISLSFDNLMSFARFFSLIVDCRSRFTATHSSGIASVAHLIGSLAGESQAVCQKLKIAGYLHDIGKVAVPNTILEKNGPLTKSEWDCVHSHPYYTREILGQVRGLEEIIQWASDHHETLDGRGYPRHLAGAEISLKSQILSVADIFTALTEDRPYRLGMERAQVLNVFGKMAADGKLNSYLVGILTENYPMIECTRRTAQMIEIDQLTNFWISTKQIQSTRTTQKKEASELNA